MLNYIKSQIKAQYMPNEKTKTEPVTESATEVSNDVILEYAKLFQELDDLTEEGTEEGKVRQLGVDIPLDDDIEVDNVEFNLSDGKLTDVPGDATVAESYMTMKTLDMFIQEVMDRTPRMSRESDYMYNNRITNIANKLYEEYCIDAEETGQFGFDKISVGDDRVPTKALIEFGSNNNSDSDSRNLTMKIPVTFATDENHQITKKQFDSFGFVKNGAFTNIGTPLMQYMESNYAIPEKSSLWDIVTPTGLYIPKGNGDSFCVVLEFMNEITNKKEYFGWTRSVRNDDKSDINTSEQINMESFVEESSWENHDGYLIDSEKRARRERMKRPIGRFYQEAIDFGGGDDSGSDAPADDNGGGDDLPPAPDDSGSSDESSDSGDTSETSTDDSSAEAEDKETAAVNDVSADIAKEVADRTKEDTSSDTDVTFDDDEPSGGIEQAAENDDDGTLDDLASDAENDEPMDEDTEMNSDVEGDMNFDSMTIDDLLERGSDKLKSMTLNEIKDFISSSDEDAVQEAFFLTKNNINKEVDVNIRKCLGILNDANMNVDKIFKKFKLAGHKLNRVLSKAVKMEEVYNKDEREAIKKLNRSLGDLLSSLRITQKDKNVPSIKKKITDFINETKIVSVFVEDKLLGKAVQESYVQEGFFLSASNVKKKLAKVLIPVIEDVSDIVNKADSNRLTRGTIVKMYKGKTYKNTYGTSYGNNDNFGNFGTYETEHTSDTSHTNAIAQLAKLLNKIDSKKRIGNAFNNNELNKLHELSEALSTYTDFIESIVFDNQSSETTLNQFISDSKRLLSLLNSVNDIVGQSASASSKTLTNSIKAEEAKQDNQKGDDK